MPSLQAVGEGEKLRRTTRIRTSWQGQELFPCWQQQQGQQGSFLPFTSCPHPSTFTSQLGSPGHPCPKCSGGGACAKNKGH